MRKQTAKLLLLLSIVASLGAIPATASAKHGADDPAGHVSGGGGADDPAGHR
jgi:hypothetical protein